MKLPFKVTIQWRPMLRMLQALSYLSIIPAAVFFIYEQRAAREAAQLDAAQTLMLEANSGELAVLAKKLSAPWIEPDYIARRKAGVTMEAHEQLKADKFSEHEISMPDILQLANFYEIVLLCQQSEACDAPMIETYFGSEMQQFSCFFQPQIDDMRQRLGRADLLTLLTGRAIDCTDEEVEQPA